MTDAERTKLDQEIALAKAAYEWKLQQPANYPEFEYQVGLSKGVWKGLEAAKTYLGQANVQCCTKS